MLRVFIAEDEPPIRRDLAAIVSGIEGVELCGCASDGETALASIREAKPDIVVTDIRMPVKDGLEIIECVQRTDPDVRFIIISGYDDFSYAQAALRLRVEDYMLKPVEPALLAATLQKAGARVQQGRRSRDDRAWQAALAGTTDPTASLRSAACPVPFTPVLVVIGPLSRGERRDDIPPSAASLLETAWAALESVRCSGHQARLVRTPLANEGLLALTALPPARGQEAGSPGAGSAAPAVPESCLQAAITQRSPLPCTIVIGKTLASLDELAPAFLRLRQTADRGAVPGQRSVLHEGEAAQGQPVFALSEIQRRSYDALFSHDLWDVAEQEVLGLLDEWSAARVPQRRQEECLRELFALSERSLPARARAADADPVHAAVQAWWECGDTPAGHEKIAALFRRLTPEVARVKDKLGLVADIEAYLNEHLAEPLTSQHLGVRFAMAPYYLNEIYKRARGITPPRYLEQIRIEKAVQLMREKPDLLLKDIARIVGFEDQAYFSKVFKRVKGVAPADFRDAGVQQ